MILIAVVVGLTVCNSLVFADSPPCTKVEHHPAYSSSIQPALIRCWSYMDAPRMPRTAYLAKYKTHRYAPASDPSSLIYDGLDWFWSQSGHGDGPDFIKLHFNRYARVFLVVPLHRNSDMESPSLPGWRSYGEVRLVEGEDAPFTFGVHQKYQGEYGFYERAYIFQKMGKDVELPHQEWIKRNLDGFELPRGHSWIAMIAELDGTAWEVPPNPTGVDEPILPNHRCPDALHDLWVTPNTDDDDPDTEGKLWKTWHPVWDPIYWCAYDHEHGSSSVDLMNYWPKYEYTSWKNDREDETNEGFKNIIVDAGAYRVLFVVHMQTSQLRRVETRWHSIHLVVVYTETRKVMAEITHKGDFGFLSARISSGRFMALSPKDEEMQEEMFQAPRRRSINIIDEDNLDTRLLYRFPRYTLPMGVYEDWTTVPLCGAGGRSGNLRVDVTKSATGVRAVDALDEKVYLGNSENGVFYRQAGQARLLNAPKFKFSFSHCERVLGSLPRRGVFYTDAKGENLMSGPGPDSMRQFVHPDLSFELSGDFRPSNSWTVLMTKSSKLDTDDVMFGLDPDKN